MASRKPIKVGIVGLGRAGWNMHTSELAGKERMFTIAAGCDTAKDRRDQFTEKYGRPAYKNIEDLIADDEVELVDIATRSPEHVPHTLLALKAGKDVFLEKPISLSYAEAKKLKPAAAKSKGTLYIRHNRRFEEGFLHIREIIASGILGEVYQIKLGRVGYARRDDWQTLKKCGGGQLLNWGPHIIDHALQFLEGPVESIWGDLKCIAAAGDAEDHVKITVRGKNGRVVDLEISGGASIRVPTYVVWGTKGGLQCDGDEIKLRYLNPRQKLKPRRAKSSTPERNSFGTKETLKWVEKTVKVKPKKTYDIWVELYKAIREGKPFPITLDEALEVMRVVSTVRKGTGF
ncbi:MAG: Gfo/Idh/MocA family oxidoreductase [bacterium]|nr:Gfo/Idh/MocA family oxidoreductase [bacterium]